MENIEEIFKQYNVKLPEDKVKHYKILSASDVIENEIGELVSRCMEVFGDGVPLEDCQKLLYDFNWNYIGLLEKFAGADSMDDFLKIYMIDLTIPLPSDEMVNSFVYSSSLFKFCPNAFKQCKNIIKIESSDVEEIVCECGFPFCYKCDNVPHSPFPCILLKEWLKQCQEYNLIFEHNNVICPSCSEVYSVDDYYMSDNILTCTHCDRVFASAENLLTAPGIFPEYNYYFVLSERWEKIIRLSGLLSDRENVEFFATVFKVTQNILQKVLPLPLFSFFLDKKLLSLDPASAQNIATFEFFKGEIEKRLVVLMDAIKVSSPDVQQDMIMVVLHQLQTYLDKMLKFFNETNGWIFKVPEIQEVYDTANRVKSESDDEAGADDDTMSDDYMDDDKEACSDVEDELADDDMEIDN